MALFPESYFRRPQFGYDNTPAEKVTRTAPHAGNSFIRDHWGVTRFMARMEFILQLADAYILWRWYEVNRLLSFTFYDFERGYVEAKNIGTGNGVNATFTIAGKATKAFQLSVYVNGVLKTETTHYNRGVGTGPLGEDQIIFTGGNIPAAAAAITITGHLRIRYTCEMAEAATRRSMGSDKVLISMKVQERFPLS